MLIFKMENNTFVCVFRLRILIWMLKTGLSKLWGQNIIISFKTDLSLHLDGQTNHQLKWALPIFRLESSFTGAKAPVE